MKFCILINCKFSLNSVLQLLHVKIKLYNKLSIYLSSFSVLHSNSIIDRNFKFCNSNDGSTVGRFRSSPKKKSPKKLTTCMYCLLCGQENGANLNSHVSFPCKNKQRSMYEVKLHWNKHLLVKGLKFKRTRPCANFWV